MAENAVLKPDENDLETSPVEIHPGDVAPIGEIMDETKKNLKRLEILPSKEDETSEAQQIAIDAIKEASPKQDLEKLREFKERFRGDPEIEELILSIRKKFRNSSIPDELLGILNLGDE